MRKFMKSRESFRDVRIAYTYLIILALVLTVMGLVLTQMKTQLGINELIGYRQTLAECSDSLRGFADSVQSDRKLSAALRFEIASASLICDNEARTELLRFAEVLRKSVLGEIEYPNELAIYTLADMFSVLASLDYKSGESAREHISEVLTFDFVTALTGEITEKYGSLNLFSESPELPAKIEEYNYQKAVTSAEKLLGSTLKLLRFERSEAGYAARADNIRAVFSDYDGKTESFLYIRLGKTPGTYFTENELAVYAKSLVSGMFETGEHTLNLQRLETFCGFTTCEFAAESKKIVTILDSHGRLWAMEIFEIKK